MRKTLLATGALFAAIITVFITMPAPAAGVKFGINSGHKAWWGAHEPVVQQLVDLVNGNPAFRTEMEAALSEQQPSSYWYGKTLDDMYTFFDEWVVFSPTIDNARQYMDRFYEFADAGKGQQLAARDPLRSWLYQFMLAVAQFNDSPVSAAVVPSWMADPRINIDDYIVPPGGYQNFNEFFTRRIKPGVRPIDSPVDPAVFTSPADSSIMKIADRLTSSATIGVKGENLCIRELLGNDGLANVFINGKAILCMLNTTDYHRYHAPVSGRIVSQHQMAGLYYGMDGGWVEYFFQHRRGYFILNTTKFGYVGMVCIGMFTISSVNFITNEGDFVHKGDEMGNFAYGGSAIILLFQPGRVSFTVPLAGRPVHVNMGERLATAIVPLTPSIPPTPEFVHTTPPASSASMPPPVSTPVALANIVVQSAALSASKVTPGTPVTVNVDVVNRATINGTIKLKSYVNGQEDDSKAVTVNSGSSIPVTFTVIRNQPGTYDVYVSGVSAGRFTVDEFADPNIILYISLASIFSFFILGLVYILRRKHPGQ